MTYVVKNVTQTINNDENILLYGEKFRVFGLDWYISVDTSIDDESFEAIKYVGIYLLVEGNFTKE